MAMGSWWPLLLLGGGSTATTLLLVALMSNEGILNGLLGAFTGGDGGTANPTSTTVNSTPADNIYSVAAAEASSTGRVSMETQSLIQAAMDRQADSDAAQNEIRLRELDIEAAQQSIDADNAAADLASANAGLSHEQTTAAALGGLGGAAAGAALGAALTGWSGPGIGVGIAVGAVAGALGLVSYETATQGSDWWPFW